MNFLLPAGGIRVTTLESWADAPQLDRSFLESRSALHSLCQVSHNFNAVATSYPYKIVVLKSRKDLICFFRTLLSARHLRPLVSSLVWVGVLSGLGALVQNVAQLGEAIEDEEMERVASQYWIGIDWPPAVAEDISIIRRLNLDPSNSLTFRHFQIFGAILGMTLQLESLFTTLGCVSPGVIMAGRYPECPELLGIERLLAPAQWMYGEHESISSVDLPTSSLRALKSLRTITLEAHSGAAAQTNPPALVLRLFLEFCPCLERIEIKASNHWRCLLTDQRRSEEPRPGVVHGNVKELILRWAYFPQSSLPVIGRVFPNLRRLYAEWGDESNYTSPNYGSPGMGWQSESDISPGLAGLEQTLELLHLTTKPGSSWVEPSFPSVLFPTLGRMTTLNHLTTETLWLFGKANDFTLDLESLLPPSLISLHLIDYWGVSEWDSFYPDFFDGSNQFELLTKIMRHLHVGCYTFLSKLKAIRLTSPYFSGFFNRYTQYLSKGDDYRRKVQDFSDNFLRSFEEAGVEFSIAPYDTLEENGQWSWSRVSSSPLIF